MKEELAKARLYISQLEDKGAKLEHQLADAQSDRLRSSRSRDSIDTSEILREKLAEAQVRKWPFYASSCQFTIPPQATLSEAKNERDELKNEIARRSLDADLVMKRLQAAVSDKKALEEQLEESCSQIRDLQQSNHDLQESIEAHAQNQAQFSEGATIFADVEERRMALEKENMTIKIQLQALQTNYDNAIKQRQQLKSQIQMLTQMKGNEADSAMLKRTEEALSQTKAELSEIARKYVQLQQKETKRTGTNLLLFLLHFSRRPALMSKIQPGQDTSPLIEYLQQGSLTASGDNCFS